MDQGHVTIDPSAVGMGLLFSPLPPPARRQGRRSSSHAMKQPPFPSWMVLWRCGRSLGASTDVQHQDSCRRSTSRLVPSARQEGAHSYPGWVIQRPLATSLQLNRRCFRRGHSPFFARPLAIPCGNFPSASFHPGAATRSRIYASRCPSGFECFHFVAAATGVYRVHELHAGGCRAMGIHAYPCCAACRALNRLVALAARLA